MSSAKPEWTLLRIVCRLLGIVCRTMVGVSLANHQQAILGEFGARVRKLREASGLSQERFAQVCGLHRTYVGSIERGERNVALLNLVRIAEALEVDPSRLIRGLRS